MTIEFNSPAVDTADKSLDGWESEDGVTAKFHKWLELELEEELI
jgi:hypothetical protein